MPRSQVEELFTFTDDELAWEDELTREEERRLRPRTPRPLRPRRKPQRTLAGDLALLRERLRGHVSGRALGGLLLALCLVVLGFLLTSRGGDPAGESPTRKAAKPEAASTVVAAAALEGVLRPGDRGEQVSGVQEALFSLGFAAAPDGVFEAGTGAAIAAFQAERGLTPDGIVGRATAASLRAALAGRAASDSVAAERGLAQAIEAGRLSAVSAERHTSSLAASVQAVERLPLARGAYVGTVLHDVAGHASIYGDARALALFGMLDTNTRHLATHKLPHGVRDISGADGIVYRFLPSHGFQFHPLASFARLNALARRGRASDARRLAAALVARGVRAGDSLVWEYYFPFRGPSRWTSGFAQAIAAQSLARVAGLVDDASFGAAAKSAFRAIPAALTVRLPEGPWIREYSFSESPILNAQLQSLVSLSEYVELADDAEAEALTTAFEETTRALLPRFDTGCWSLYALGGSPASDHYHAYHVSLLGQLAARTGDSLWRETGTRWAQFARERRAADAVSCA